MTVLPGGARVFTPEDGQRSAEGNRATRNVVHAGSGAKRITQSVGDYGPGVSPPVVNPDAEEVLYTVCGEGTCLVGEAKFSLRPGMAIYIPPRTVYTIANAAASNLRTVSSYCPLIAAKTGMPAAIHESEREAIRAGADRIFRYLVHTDIGCEEVTQFVGWIPRSKAPFHWHPYEEVIYILEGHGILHLEEEPSVVEFGPGASIYLPDHVVHCIENPDPQTIRLLGVFYPSGSPSEAYEDH